MTLERRSYIETDWTPERIIEELQLEGLAIFLPEEADMYITLVASTCYSKEDRDKLRAKLSAKYDKLYDEYGYENLLSQTDLQHKMKDLKDRDPDQIEQYFINRWKISHIRWSR